MRHQGNVSKQAGQTTYFLADVTLLCTIKAILVVLYVHAKPRTSDYGISFLAY